MSLDNLQPWVEKSAKKVLSNELNALSEHTTVRDKINAFSTDVLISFFERNKSVKFSKGEGSPEDSAAYIIMYQKALTVLGADITVDGIWGNRTVGAMQEFQRVHLGGGNGVPGERTTTALIEELSKVRDVNTRVSKLEKHLKEGATLQSTPEIKKVSLIESQKSAVASLQGEVSKLSIGNGLTKSEDGKTFAKLAKGSKDFEYAQGYDEKTGQTKVWGKIDPDGTRTISLLNPQGQIVASSKLDSTSKLVIEEPGDTKLLIGVEFNPKKGEIIFKK